jgi:hypothetical protein
MLDNHLGLEDFEMTTNILLYGLVCLIMSAVGLYLSYGPWTSGSWYWAYGAFLWHGEYQNVGGLREFIRIVFLLLFFILAQHFIFTEESKKYWEGNPKLLSFYRYLFGSGPKWPKWLRVFCKLAAGLAFCITVLYHVVGGPLMLFDDYNSAIVPFPLSFEEHFRPYLGYLPYSFTLYILIALPMFIVVVEGIVTDNKKIHGLAEQISEIDPKSLTDEKKIKLKAQSIVNFFLDVRVELTRTASKYVWMALLVIIYYEIEIGARLILNLACWAQEITKWCVWIFIIFILPYFIITNYRIYTRTYDNSQDNLNHLADRALELQKADTAGSVNKLRSEFETKYTALSFIMSLVKSGSVAIVVFLLLMNSTYKYLESLEPIERRKSIEIAIPWPVSPLVFAGADLLGVAPSSAVGKTDQKGLDWSQRCLQERPDGSLEWKGKPIKDRSQSFYRDGTVLASSPNMGGSALWTAELFCVKRKFKDEKRASPIVRPIATRSSIGQRRRPPGHREGQGAHQGRDRQCRSDGGCSSL